MTRISILFLTVVCLTVPLHGDVWQDLATYQYGDESKAPEALEKLVVESAPGERALIEKKIIELIQSPKATEAGKSFACRTLQRIATKASVPALSGLLGEKHLSHYARLALERMTAVPEAGAALRKALENAPDTVQAGLIASLGERRDAKAVAAIAGRIVGKTPALADVALKALGKIGTAEALKALQQVKVPKALAAAREEALIACAAQMAPASAAYAALKGVYETGQPVRRIGALDAMVRIDAAKASPIVLALIGGKPSPVRTGAIRLAVTTPGKALTDALVAALGSLDVPTRAHVVELLGKRGDAGALPAVREQLKSPEESVRVAALAAMAELGGAKDVPLLLEQAAAGGAVGSKAVEALARMSAAGVDNALVGLLQQDALRAAAIGALAARGARTATPAVIRLTSDAKADVRLAAWKNLGRLAGENDVAALMKILIGIKDDGERRAAQETVRWICSEAGDRKRCFEAVAATHDQAGEAIRLFILELGSSVGTRQALDFERAALKSGNAKARDKALRALTDWPNSGAADDLLTLAREAPQATEKILALRGYIQVASRSGNDKERAGRYQKALELTKRREDKRLLISKLKDCRHIDSFRIVAKFLEDDEVRPEAEVAAIDVGRRIGGQPKFRQEVTAVVSQIAKTSKNKGTVRRAKDCLQRIAPKKK